MASVFVHSPIVMTPDAAAKPATTTTTTVTEVLPLATPPDEEKMAIDATSEETPHDPWTSMNKHMQFRSKDAEFWWIRTGGMFARLLHRAGYTPAEQYRELLFYALFVAPELGPAPDENGNVRRWRSPGTPDSTPIDFSWEWGPDAGGGGSGRGTIRYSFEPIGTYAGTPLDPLNRFATDRWIAKLRAQNLVPGLDLEWYEHFTRAVLPRDDTERTKATTEVFVEETTPKAGTVVALDIEKSGPVMKMYIYPGLKAAELGTTNLELVKRAVRSLPQHASLRGVEPLLDFLDEGTARYGFETGILGIDCLRPADARIKIYVRAPHTTLAYLMDALTLGGRRPLVAGDALEDLKDFWQAFLADAPDVLPADAPGRASPGFYYTVGCGRDVEPKVYISPSYFCESDADCLARLGRFFATRRSDAMMENYEKALREIFDAKTLEERCGSHYYVGCALHKDKLRVVTYLTPQTFACERDRIAARRQQQQQL